MNEERLLKITEDMAEVLKNLTECKNLLKSTPENNATLFIEFGLKQIFVDFFITVESLSSLILKELREFKVGLDMKQALLILLEKKVINDETYSFLNQARLLRNRISHRYKEPSKDELLEFIDTNMYNFDEILKLAKHYLN